MSFAREMLYMLDDMCERTDISKEDRLEFSKARDVLRAAMREGRDELDAVKVACGSLIKACDLWIKKELH
jgi:hypothetical protein